MASRVVYVAACCASGAAVIAALGYAYWTDRARRAPFVEPDAAHAAAATSPAPAPAVAAVPVGAHAAPFELYATAERGDWRAYTVVTETALGTYHATVLATVTDATTTAVTVTTHGAVAETREDMRHAPDEYPRTGLTLEHAVGADVGGSTLSAITVAADTHVVDGRSFACTKVTYSSSDPLFPSKQTRTELWLSPEVPVGGVLGWREEQHLGALTFVITLETMGFGDTHGRTVSIRWGQRPDL